MPHKIERINEYNDTRFPREVLLEHGAFLIDDKYKCSFKITTKNTAIVEFDKEINIEDIQPSQFYVDKNKVESVAYFIKSEDDIIIPLAKINDELVSVDGHTRLYLATKRDYKQVYGFYTLTEDYISDFVLEAKRRNILTPYDLQILKHNEYKKKWNEFCNNFFRNI